jgi:hypothetical protein
MSTLGNPTACLSRLLKSKCDPVTKKRIKFSRGFSSIYNLDSRSDDWCKVMGCIEEHVTSGYITAEIICERPGVFGDCEHCDEALQITLRRHTATHFAEMIYFRALPPVFKFDAQTLPHISRMLSNPARPNCGNKACLKRPTPKDEYVATLWMNFKDAIIHINFFSVGESTTAAPPQPPTKKRKTKQ